MPIYELAAALNVSSGTTEYLGPVNLAGFTQLTAQVTLIGTASGGTVTVVGEVNNDQTNWSLSGGESVTVTDTTRSNLGTMIGAAKRGAGFTRLKVTSTVAATIAVTVNTSNP